MTIRKMLLVSGTALFLLLLLNVTGEINTTYLKVMAIKLALVAVKLCFAAHHTWRFVVNLNSADDRIKTKKSIIAEAMVGTLVIAVAATLISSFGIAHEKWSIPQLTVDFLADFSLIRLNRLIWRT